MEQYKINDFITLILEKNETNIYIASEKFRQCKYLLLNIPLKKINNFDQVESIDDAAEMLDKTLERRKIHWDIAPEVEFWGHCSNIEAWVENDYDTRLLHSNIAFPLLKKLVEVGDKKAKKVYKEEIALRLKRGNAKVAIFLINGKYLDVFSIEELSIILNNIDVKIFSKNLYISHVVRNLLRRYRHYDLTKFLSQISNIDLLKLIINLLIESNRYDKALLVQKRIGKLDPSEKNLKLIKEISIKEKKIRERMEKLAKFEKFISNMENKNDYVDEVEIIKLVSSSTLKSLNSIGSLFDVPIRHKKKKIRNSSEEKIKNEILEKEVNKIKKIMEKNNLTTLVFERKYLFELFDDKSIKISDYDKFPILKKKVLFEFFSRGIISEVYGPLIKFIKKKKN